MLLLSIIIPVYNRPAEMEDLLRSLVAQTRGGFEVIVVEDGSTATCERIVQDFSDKLNVRYYFKENSGPGLSRNFGAAQSTGAYLIFLDSDCVLPPAYIGEVEKAIARHGRPDAFGGPDRADDTFTVVQKAINYSMTSFFTTGGIRGKKKIVDRFYPRSFNMGVNRDVFNAVGGFSGMRFGEDIDLSTRIYNNGGHCLLFDKAWVFHKRRTDYRQFFRQVYHSGAARVALMKKYPSARKLVYLMPALFTAFSFAILVASSFSPALLLLFAALALLLFVDASVANRSMTVGLNAVLASYIQLWGYGCGFIAATARSVMAQSKN